MRANRLTAMKLTDKIRIQGLVLCWAVMLPLTAVAHCPQEATAGAPRIPNVGDVSYEQVKMLGAEVKTYLNRAGAKLSSCDETDDAFLFNAAVAELEDVAARYNELAEAYNRSLATIN